MTDLDYLGLRQVNSAESARRASCSEAAIVHHAFALNYARRIHLGLLDEHISLD